MSGASVDLQKAAVAEEIRRYQEERLRFYHEGSDLCAPNPIQLEFHKSQAKIRGLFAGNQAGKTFAGTVEMLWVVAKVHPYRSNYIGLVYGRDCCDYLSTLRTTLIPTYNTLVPRDACVLPGRTFEGGVRRWPGIRGGSWKKAWSDDDKTLFLGDGSFIEFKSYEQGREAFQGPVRHIIRMDEEPPESIYNENQLRQATVGRNLIFTLTPLNYSQWLFNDVYEKAVSNPQVAAFKMSTYDNPYSDPEEIKQIEQNVSDPIERAARLYGDFTFAAGRVYTEYGDHNVHVPFEIPSGWARSIIIDAHLEKPTYVLWAADSPAGKRFYYREMNIKGPVEQICKEIKALCGDEYIDLMLIDPSARQKASIYDKGPLIVEFRKHLPGLVEANNNVMLGIDATRRAFKNGANGPMSYVFKGGIGHNIGCPILHFQLSNYSWKPPTVSGESRGKPEVVKKNDEGPDCVRYREMYGLRTRTQDNFKGFNVGVYAN